MLFSSEKSRRTQIRIPDSFVWSLQTTLLFHFRTFISPTNWSDPAGLKLVRPKNHYSDIIMGTIASKITRLTIVYSTVYSDADQRKHKSSASLAFVSGIHRGPVNSPHKWPVTRKMFPLDDVIMISLYKRFCYQEANCKMSNEDIVRINYDHELALLFWSLLWSRHDMCNWILCWL